MYRIFLTDEFLKQLDKIEPHIRKKLDRKIEEYISPRLKEEPHFGQNIKKLRNYIPETWRYRIGSFRLFYIIVRGEKGSRIRGFRKAKGSRSQGFEDSSEKPNKPEKPEKPGRGLEGWRVGYTSTLPNI